MTSKELNEQLTNVENNMLRITQAIARAQVELRNAIDTLYNLRTITNVEPIEPHERPGAPASIYLKDKERS